MSMGAPRSRGGDAAAYILISTNFYEGYEISHTQPRRTCNETRIQPVVEQVENIRDDHCCHHI